MEESTVVYEDGMVAKGWKWFGKVLAIAIILVVAAFGDVMYLQLMSGKFPGGPLLILCYIGAFSSFLAVVYMLVGKTILFTPGRQMIVAWLVFVAELMMIALNVILIFQGTANQSGFLYVWLQASPATPVINMVGVAILFFLDEEQTEHHEDIEQRVMMRKSERKYERAMHSAKLNLRHKQLKYTISALEDAVNSPESLSFIQETAAEMNAALLSELSGRSYGRVHSLPSGASNSTVPPTISHRPTAIPPQEAAKLDKSSVEADKPSQPPFDVQKLMQAMDIPPDHEEEFLDTLRKKGVIASQASEQTKGGESDTSGSPFRGSDEHGERDSSSAA